jgi:rare lipoprotein A
MCSIGGDGSTYIGIGPDGARRAGRVAELALQGVRSGVRWVAAAVAGATLVACTQHAGITDRSASLATGRHAPAESRLAEPRRTASSPIHRRAVAAKKHAPVVASKRVVKRAVEAEDRANGLASFYRYGTQTANGEKFDPGEMTAAHRTLPFGTRLRVTNTTTGQSVTVRVNDRGPFIAGRVVDLSQSAAETLGIVRRGVAKVKLDVVKQDE